MTDRLIYDPTANAKVRESRILTLAPTGGYSPMLSPSTGQWFAHQNWDNSSCALCDVAEDQRAAFDEAIERHELVEDVVARCELHRSKGKRAIVEVSEGRHDHVTRAAVFSQVRVRGYSNDEIAYAYESLDVESKPADSATIQLSDTPVGPNEPITEADDDTDSSSDD